MPKSKPSVVLKLKNNKEIKVEPYCVHGCFMAHNKINNDLSVSSRYFTVTHIPTGWHVFLLCPFKSKAAELAKLLSELVGLGLISTDIHKPVPDLAKKAFSKKARDFLGKVEELCIRSTKAKELAFQNLFDEMFQEELNSRPTLEQQSLFGSN